MSQEPRAKSQPLMANNKRKRMCASSFFIYSVSIHTSLFLNSSTNPTLRTEDFCFVLL